MGVIHRTIEVPDLYNYEPEFNRDGSEKHIVCDGARYHVLHYSSRGVRCSETNCEVNRRSDQTAEGK